MQTELHCFGGNTALLAALIESAVQFLLVGGFAVKFYAQDREADDLDLLLEQSDENGRRLLAALTSIHMTPNFTAEQFATGGKKQMALKTVHYADLITDPDIDFGAEVEDAQSAKVNGYPVKVASKALLLRMKTGTARPDDIKDIDLLRG